MFVLLQVICVFCNTIMNHRNCEMFIIYTLIID